MEKGIQTLIKGFYKVLKGILKKIKGKMRKMGDMKGIFWNGEMVRIMALKEFLFLNQQGFFEGFLSENISEMGIFHKRHNKASSTHIFSPNLFLES